MTALPQAWKSGAPVHRVANSCMSTISPTVSSISLVHYSGEVPLNIGTGSDVTIRELAETIASIVGFRGSFHYNTEKPDGTPRKRLDVSVMDSLGWRSRICLETGLRETCAWMTGAAPGPILPEGSSLN